MTDLCHSCGDCHLPKPCPIPLKLCDICKSWGHSYNFCPLSVRKKEPNYQFWALCHNCDAWHLPDECNLVLHMCAQCGHAGHLEYFCPVNALSRQATHALNDAKTGTKRQRTSDSDIKPNGIDVNDPLRGEHIRLIRAEAAREVLDFRNRGYADNDILQHITRAPLQASYGNTYAASTPGSSVFNLSNVNATPSTNATTTLQQPVTPSSTSLYASQQERFSSGELLQSVTSSFEAQDVPDASMGTNSTPVPRKKGNRARANSACADCKGSKKRCPHKGDAASMEAANREVMNTALVPPAGYVEAGLDFNNSFQNSRDWMAPFGTAMTAPYYTGGPRQASSKNAQSTPTDHTQGLAKSTLAHLLNDTPATGPAMQTTAGTYKPFTYSASGNDLRQSINLDANKQVSAMSDESTARDVPQMSTEQPQPMTNQAETKDIVVAPIATQESIQEPEPSQEANAEAKPKKPRGRPKRKN